MDEVSFCWGFLAGVILAGIIAYILQRIRLASIRSRAANSKQPVRGQTDLTPQEVVRRARGAQLEILIWIGVIFAIFACVTFFLLQGR